MKEFVKFEKEIGGDGAKVEGVLGVEQSTLKLAVSASYPIAKIVDPVMVAFDQLVDKLEQLIPGDQTVLAAQAKAEARTAVVKALSEVTP